MIDEDDFDESFLKREPRSEEELSAAIDRLIDQVWYNRHRSLRIWETTPEIFKMAKEAAKKVEARTSDLGPWTDFEWGMINGKLSALRWLQGEEWDFLDT